MEAQQGCDQPENRPELIQIVWGRTGFNLAPAILTAPVEGRCGTVRIPHNIDIDQALFLADRLVRMSPGPAATIGEVRAIPGDSL